MKVIVRDETKIKYFIVEIDEWQDKDDLLIQIKCKDIPFNELKPENGILKWTINENYDVHIRVNGLEKIKYKQLFDIKSRDKLRIEGFINAIKSISKNSQIIISQFETTDHYIIENNNFIINVDYILNAFNSIKYLVPLTSYQWFSHSERLFLIKFIFNDHKELKNYIDETLLFSTHLHLYNVFGKINEDSLLDLSFLKSARNSLQSSLNSEKNHSESHYQSILIEIIKYLWTGYTKIEKERQLESIDGKKKYVDFFLKGLSSDLIIEIKKPTLKIMNNSLDRNNFFPTATLSKAATQLIRYIESLDNEYKAKRISKEVKGIIIMGRDSDIEDKHNDFAILKRTFSGVEIFTYDEILLKLSDLIDNLEK